VSCKDLSWHEKISPYHFREDLHLPLQTTTN
jgi:hypothetical protein